MNRSERPDLESFVLEACEELGIPVTRPSSLEIELHIPGKLRRHFGNLENLRITANAELRRMDPDLEYLAPRSFVIECLRDLLGGQGTCWGTLVAGFPEKVDALDYASSFRERFISPLGEGTHRDGRLPPGVELRRVDQIPAYRPLLRVLVDTRLRGGEPIHEVFPIFVCLRSLKPVQAIHLKDRRLYGLEELGNLRDQIPRLPERALVKRGLEVASQVVRAAISSLGRTAQEGMLADLKEEEAQISSYFRQQLLDNANERQVLEQQRDRRLEQLRARGHVDTQVALRQVTVIFEIAPRLLVRLRDVVSREHTLDIPAIPGRVEIPDDAVTCGHFEVPLVLVADDILCVACAPPCKRCGCGVRGGRAACVKCRELGELVCARCVHRVADDLWACEDHSYICTHGERRLRGDEVKCLVCEIEVCDDPEHRHVCHLGKEAVCASCDDGWLLECPECGRLACSDHRVEECRGEIVCNECVVTCANDGRIHRRSHCTQCSSCAKGGTTRWLCEEHREAVACAHDFCCPEHVRNSQRESVRVCASCLVKCPSCELDVGDHQTTVCSYEECDERICAEPADHHCVDCESSVCPAHLVECSVTGARCCLAHSVGCALCPRHIRTSVALECPDCSSDVCPNCSVLTASGRRLCRACTAVCAEDGASYARRELFACVDHGDNQSLFCEEHSLLTSCCNERVCRAHMSRSVVSDAVVCAACGSTCHLCNGRLLEGEGKNCSSCGAVYCDVVEPAPRCSEGCEVLCAEHMRPCLETGAPLCHEHSHTCSKCSGWITLGRETRCGICSTPLCTEHAPRCSECQQPLCELHGGTTKDGLGICANCGFHCRDCPPSTWIRGLPGDKCAECSQPLCGEHRRACHVDQKVLCKADSGRSSLHSATFCRSHFGKCKSCGIDEVLDANGLCDLCMCFVAGSTDPNDLPFDHALVAEEVRRQVGFLHKIAQVRWRVGEKFVLVWMQSGVLKNDFFAVFKRDGERVRFMHKGELVEFRKPTQLTRTKS